MLQVSLKRGDTFFLTCTYKINGVASALPAGIRAQVRDKRGVLMGEATVTRIPANAGQYTLQIDPEVTKTWTKGKAQCDIQYTTDDGKVVSTPTFDVVVTEDVTYD